MDNVRVPVAVYVYINNVAKQSNDGILACGSIDWEEAARFVNEKRLAAGEGGEHRLSCATQSLWHRGSKKRDPVLQAFKSRYDAFLTWKRWDSIKIDQPVGSIKQLIVFNPLESIQKIVDGMDNEEAA